MPPVEDTPASGTSGVVAAPSLQVRLEIEEGGERGWLVWETENADFVLVDQGLGRLLPRGRLELPRAALTKTYTLTAEGPGGSVSRQIQGTHLDDSGSLLDAGDSTRPHRLSEEAPTQALQPILFSEYSFELDEAARDLLNRNLNWLLLPDNASAHLVITSVSDPKGTEEYGLCLASARAQVVASFLRKRGISETRIETMALGEEVFSSPALPEEDAATLRFILSDSDIPND